ncbi:MAG: glycine zipper family protein, partial [Planctomycetaceae bacterium]
MKGRGSLLLLLAWVALSGCATIPTGPSVLVWPGPAKPFDVFQSDDLICRQYASRQVGAQPGESANATLASGAALGTAL